MYGSAGSIMSTLARSLHKTFNVVLLLLSRDQLREVFLKIDPQESYGDSPVRRTGIPASISIFGEIGFKQYLLEGTMLDIYEMFRCAFDVIDLN
ncbi:UNVERIFIED_CONTAM: hypothetical protein NCL1_53699 [Trichonephila clavipes]